MKGRKKHRKAKKGEKCREKKLKDPPPYPSHKWRGVFTFFRYKSLLKDCCYL